MNRIVLLYHLARADFLERVRRSSFLVTLVMALYLGYLYLPANDAGYVTVAIDETRGVYNSAWIGAVIALLNSTFLSLIGFYLVKNAVARDIQTRVGQILAGTPMTKFEYLLGKMLSNFAVLSAVVVGALVSAGVTQIIRGEDTSINIWQLVAPSLIFALPFLMVVSALAVLFEVTPVLRGSGGNVIYFFVWNGMLVASLLGAEMRNGITFEPMNDPGGFSHILAPITKAAFEAMPNLKNNIAMGIQITERGAQQAHFLFSGISYSLELIGQRLLWVLAAIGIILVATPIFRRFEAIESKNARQKEGVAEREEVAPIVATGPRSTQLTPLVDGSRFSLMVMYLAEMRLLWRSVNRWWLFGALALVVATLVTPMAAARQYIFPIAWIWPLAIWSSMGVREKKFGVEQFLFTCPRPLMRQFSAIWIAGVSVAALTGSGMLIRFLLSGDMAGLIACLVGVVFIPTLALAFGVLTSGQLLFECVYVAIWYIGPMNHVPMLDFMGASAQISPGNSIVFAAAIPLLAMLAIAARRRQMTL